LFEHHIWMFHRACLAKELCQVVGRTRIPQAAEPPRIKDGSQQGIMGMGGRRLEADRHVPGYHEGRHVASPTGGRRPLIPRDKELCWLKTLFGLNLTPTERWIHSRDSF
jgi:hypothetical protein